jgi:hypothetical protein
MKLFRQALGPGKGFTVIKEGSYVGLVKLVMDVRSKHNLPRAGYKETYEDVLADQTQRRGGASKPPGGITLTDAIKASKAAFKLALTNAVVSQAEINARAAICVQCPRVAVIQGCSGST